MTIVIPSLSSNEIVNVGTLQAGLWAATADSARHGPEARGRVLALAKDSLNGARARIRRRFEAGMPVAALMAAEALAVDRLITVLLDFAATHVYPAANPTTADRLAVIAVGGYGRGELAPYSDVDLLFLIPYKRTPRVEQIVEFALYLLWDMGLKVGHATRSIEDCIRLARADMVIRTSLLEARYLWGAPDLHDELRRRFNADIVAGTSQAFIAAKLAERDERHRRMGDSRYVLEPNVKDGKGGLRDLHTLYWIAKYHHRVENLAGLVAQGVFTAAEAQRFTKSHDFLAAVRCRLHYLTGRGDDRLTFDAQSAISAQLGYKERAGLRAVERFMKHYYLVAKHVGDLTRIFCAAIEASERKGPRSALARLWTRGRAIDGFTVDGDRLNVADASRFLADPVNILRLFHTAQAHDLDVHPRALHLITQNIRLVDAELRANPEANRLFLDMLTSLKDPETTLRRLNEAGVFGRLIPAFGRVVAQMQYDMYHVYTVDEHTIRAIGILHAIEAGRLRDELPLSSEVVHKLPSRRVLYLSVLLHDIAKGRGGDHSVLGAGIANELCPHLGLSEEETETVAWLVLHHLAMSRTAFRRDLADPQTVRDFVALVQSRERLRLLLVLTVVDIRAVGPQVWNGWKAALLRDLHLRADELMSGAARTAGVGARTAAVQEAVRPLVPGWDDAAFKRHAERCPSAYWLAWDVETLARHAHLLMGVAAGAAPLLIETRVDLARAVTEVTICTQDHPGLFSRIAGAMAVSGANIVDARIFTLLDGLALDSFWIQDAEGRAFDRADRLARLTSRIREALGDRLNLMAEFATAPPWRSRAEPFAVVPRVLIDNQASATQTVIEVNGRDRPGFLYDVTGSLTQLGLQISAARISTYGERVADVFYVKDAFGMKVEHEGKLKQIQETLRAAIATSGSTEAAPVVAGESEQAAAE
ncbi:MAG: [protein-PII] uridylyltransferase [Alphaproteobacteria bacterium]|nr:[protein-PII] uridylyltransferase [Alphaproteobacteria bacterium]